MKDKLTYQELQIELEQLRTENEILKKEKSIKEKQLEESNNQLEMFFRQSMLGFFFMMLDKPIEWNENIDKKKTLDSVFKNQRITKINQAMLNQYGAKEEEFIGFTPTDFFEHDIEYGRSLWEGFFNKGHLKIDTNEQKFDGTPLILEGDYICLYDNKGRITGHFGIQREVTQERNDAKNLKESVTNFKTLFNSIDNYLFIFDEQGNIIEINDAVKNKLQYSIEELKGKNVLIIHPENRREEVKEILMEMLQGKCDYCPVPLLTKDDKIIPVETYITRGKWNGKPALFGVSKDISDIKASEEKFAKAFQQSPAVLGLSDFKTGEYVEVNQTFYDKLGFTKEEVIGVKVSDIIKMETKFRKKVLVQLSKKGEIRNLETRIKTKKGESFDILISADKINIQGRDYNFTTVIDISDRKKVEEKLQHREMLLSALFKTLPHIIWLKDVNGIYLSCNPRFEQFFGAKEADILGKTDYDFVNKELAKFFIEKDKAVLEAGKPIKNEEVITFASDGHTELLETTKAPMYDFDGNLIGVLGTAYDITDRKKIEKELKEQKQRLNDIIEGTNIGTWEWNVQTGETIFNERWAEIIGYTLEELNPISIEIWTKFAHPEDFKRSEKLLQKHFAGELDYYEFECRMKHKNGAWIWVFDRGKVTKWDEEKKPLWMYGTHQEITDRKKAEIELKESQELFSAFMNNLPAIVFIKDQKTRTIFTNKYMNETLGSNEKWIGKTVFEIFGNNEMSQKMMADDKRVFDLGFELREEDVPTINGELQSFETRKFRIDRENKSSLLGGIALNITERKKAEKELIVAKEKAEEKQKIINQVSYNLTNAMFYQVLVPKTNKRIFIFVSETVKKFYNCTPEEVMLDANLIYKKVHPDDITQLAKKEEIALNLMSEFNVTIRLYNPDGTIRWSNIKSKPRKTDKGICWDGIEMDITELKTKETELLKSKERAEESDRLKSAFLANMSHEIRTPMNAIIGFAQFMKNRNKTRDDLDKYADIITNSGNHLLSLINDIIDISKIDAGEVNIYLEEIELNKTLRSLYNFFHSQLISRRKYDMQIFVQIPKGEFFIKTDETRLRQILINLLGNAMKFTHVGFIEFGYRIVENKLLFYVKDTGIGMSEEKQKHIFKRFRQASTSTEKLYGGTGLGLSIAKACTELLNGEIWCQSYKGKGTTFFFTIELEKCASPAKEQVEDICLKKIRFNGEHILIAEDDNLNFQYLEEVFNNYDIKIIRTKTGSETVKIIQENKDIKLILMDIQMPSMNGWEATIQIRKKGFVIPIIAQTAYAFETDRQKSFDAGCDDYITKPTEPKKIIELVSKYLNNN